MIPPCPELAVWMEGGMLEVRKDQEASRVVVVAQLLSRVQFFAVSWTVARRACLSFTVSWGWLSSCPLSWWCYLILCCLLLLLPSVFPSIRVFSSELALHIRWPKYWSFHFSRSPSNECSRLILTGLISLLPRDSQQSSPASKFESINSSVLSLPYDLTLRSVPDYWKNHSFDYTHLCWQSDVSAFQYSI